MPAFRQQQEKIKEELAQLETELTALKCRRDNANQRLGSNEAKQCRLHFIADQEISSLISSAEPALNDSEIDVVASALRYVHGSPSELLREILELRKTQGGPLKSAASYVLEVCPPIFETRVKCGEWTHAIRRTENSRYTHGSFRT